MSDLVKFTAELVYNKLIQNRHNFYGTAITIPRWEEIEATYRPPLPPKRKS